MNLRAETLAYFDTVILTDISRALGSEHSVQFRLEFINLRTKLFTFLKSKEEGLPFLMYLSILGMGGG